MEDERKGIDMDESFGGVVSGNEIIGYKQAITARGSRDINISNNIIKIESLSESEMNELRERLKEAIEALDVIENNKGVNNLKDKVLDRVTENSVDVLYKLTQLIITGEWKGI